MLAVLEFVMQPLQSKHPQAWGKTLHPTEGPCTLAPSRQVAIEMEELTMGIIHPVGLTPSHGTQVLR